MMRTLLATLAVAAIVIGCGGPGATTRPSGGASAAPSAGTSAAPSAAVSPSAAASAAATDEPSAPASAAASPSAAAQGPVCENLPEEAAGDLLETICQEGTITMSTDPAYPPQSELTPEGEYQGFDISVGQEIAERLGVELAFETPEWDVITAGSWQGRWDFSVGSMTVTAEREEVLDFTQPYYYTPAQLAVREGSDVTDLEGLAGRAICVGRGTTYLQWLDGTLALGGAVEVPEPPEGATAVTLRTDRDCAEAWRAGREDFDGWMSSSTTIADAVADGLPVVPLEGAVFNEPLAAALDKSAPDHDQLLGAIDQIIGDMHADGTLSSLSEEWLGSDLTKPIE